MKKYEFKHNGIGYSEKDLREFFITLKNFTSLTDIGRKNIDFILSDLSDDEDKIICRLSLCEYIPVSKGFCPGIDNILKYNDEELKYDSKIIERLNTIVFKYTGSKNNYFDLCKRYFRKKPYSNDSYYLQEVECYRNNLIKVVEMVDF